MYHFCPTQSPPLTSIAHSTNYNKFTKRRNRDSLEYIALVPSGVVVVSRDDPNAVKRYGDTCSRTRSAGLRRPGSAMFGGARLPREDVFKSFEMALLRFRKSLCPGLHPSKCHRSRPYPPLQASLHCSRYTDSLSLKSKARQDSRVSSFHLPVAPQSLRTLRPHIHLPKWIKNGRPCLVDTLNLNAICSFSIMISDVLIIAIMPYALPQIGEISQLFLGK